MHILIIEDNPVITAALRRILEEQRHSVHLCATGFDGEAKAASEIYDVIILDLMLPDRDGIDICRALRRHGVHTPIVILTSLTAVEQKVKGLKAGADDYLTKPVDSTELLARLEAVTRRSQGESDARLTFEDLVMDLFKRRVTRAGKPIRLTAKEWDLLEYFMRNPHRVLSKRQLGTRVWDMDYEEDCNSVEVYVSRLRRKIDNPFDKPLLHTVIRVGYALSNEPPAG